MPNDAERGGFDDLLDKLWVERRALELLVYKLTTLTLVVPGRHDRFVGSVLREIEDALEGVRLAGLGRAVALAALAEAWGVPPERVSLPYLRERAPEPAGALLTDHGEALASLVSEVRQLTRAARTVVAQALAEISRALAVAEDEASKGEAR